MEQWAGRGTSASPETDQTSDVWTSEVRPADHIGALYAVENEIRGCAPDERRQVRSARSRPLLDAMHEWLEASLAKLSKKSDTSMAIRYALTRWDALVRFCDDGSIEIDNSAAERALRGVAIGRKNYLFAGSDRGESVPRLSIASSGPRN